MMVKMSAAQAKRLVDTLHTTSATLRKLAAERDALMEVLAAKCRDEEISQVKRAMLEKGINPWGTAEATDAELAKIAQEGKLETFKKAVELSADLSVAKIGEVLESDSGSTPNSARSREALDAHILG